jgi:hypothetical protein
MAEALVQEQPGDGASDGSAGGDSHARSSSYDDGSSGGGCARRGARGARARHLVDLEPAA